MLDVLGGGSYIWRMKHNVFHHTHPNVAGLDVDVYAEPLVRMAPSQPLRRFHRFQHVYIWVLYALFGLKWQLIDDFEVLRTEHLASLKVPRPRGARLLGFLAGKAFFLGWAFIIPMLLHPFWHVLLAYVATVAVLGLMLGVVFQLAHCVEEAEFPRAQPLLERSWAVHQVETTVDFAQGNRLLSWYVGGLNFQIEHHLFPTVCHVHYRALSEIVRATCLTHGVRYREHRTFAAGIASHARWMKRMGNVPATAACL
jgi:linoleoyl-CoA desaturase